MPEIRVLAPSLERGLDESSLRSDQTCDIVDVDLDIDDDDDSDRYPFTKKNIHPFTATYPTYIPTHPHKSD